MAAVTSRQSPAASRLENTPADTALPRENNLSEAQRHIRDLLDGMVPCSTPLNGPAVPQAHEQAETLMEISNQLREQRTLEAEYIDWAARVLVHRQTAAGDPSYSPGDHAPPNLLSDASLGIAYAALTAGLKSSSRSPFRVGAAERLDTEFTQHYDVSVTSGAIAGIPATLVAQTLIPAMERRAKIANFDALKAVDPKVLFPDPGPVVLQVRVGDNGEQYKHFVRVVDDLHSPDSQAQLSPPDAPSRKVLQAEVESQREQLKIWQAICAGQSAGTLNKPLWAGAIGALRRLWSPDALLITAGGALGSTAAASFSAAFIDEALRSIVKAAPRTSAMEVDNLVGGVQRMNTFKLDRAHPDAPAAQWTDIREAPAFTADVLRESAALLRHALLPSWQTDATGESHMAWNIANTAKQMAGLVTANVFAAVTGNAVGPYFAQIVRGNTAGSGGMEPPQSAANAAEGFATSGMNELVWSLLSSSQTLGGLAPAQHQTLDRHRDKTEDALERKVEKNLTSLNHLQAQLDDAMESGQPTDRQALMAEMALLEKANAQLQRQLVHLRDWRTQPASQR
ncbi:MAG: hypothetical protein ACK40L_02135 [Hydrogenophaga sp.]